MDLRFEGFLRILAQNGAISLALAGLQYLLDSNATFGNFGRLLAEVFVYANFISFPAHWVLPRVFRIVAHRRSAVQWIVFAPALTVVTAMGSVLGSLVVAGLNLEPGMQFGELLSVSLKVSVFVALLIGVAEVMFRRLRGQLEDTRLQLRTQELERERALKLASQARLASLEARLHPHFLFNTLNSISSLIPADPQRAERLIERMAALLRFSLEANQGGLIELEQEMRIVRDYLEIEQARLGTRLRYCVDAGAGLDALHLPPLAIQTLVENSIKHAVAPSRTGGEIRVQAARQNGSLRIEVADTGPGFGPGISMEAMPAGHGLDNLRHRLEVLFGDAAELRMGRGDGWTTVSLKVPA